jgi:soluble epoxide hydrolase/lipid-phosphate phosphatase
MLGYGNTDMPLDSKEYSTKRLAGDLAALLDLLGIQKAVREGRDAGSHLSDITF